MRRVVITGMGIVSCIGNDQQQVLSSLRHGKSGIRYIPEYEQVGLRAHIAGRPDIDLDAFIGRKQRRFMTDASCYASISLQQAIEQAGLTADQVSNPRTGVVAGSGGSCSSQIIETAEVFKERGIRKVGPYRVTRTMGSSVSANLATSFGIQGVNYSLTSACATGSHAIGNAMELIQWGKQDIVFAGAGEDEHWSSSLQFDAMGALTCTANDNPQRASRPYDAHRDGFVIAGGGAMLVVEEYEHALQRGAHIIAELTGYSATSDGVDMVAPSGEGAARCMTDALAMAKQPKIDYINTHGTSTQAGDITELQAIEKVFDKQIPAISSTKSLTGHSLGAAGVQEAVYSLLMLQHNFICASHNIENLDPGAEGFPIVRQVEERPLYNVLSNSFGFGGTNACLVFRKLI